MGPPDLPPAPDSAARVRELVAECIDRFEAEGAAAIESVCAAHPAEAAAIRTQVARLAQIGLLRRFDGGAGGGDEDDRFPERLGEFRLIRRLGGGGMGLVYLAEQTSLGRLVALKVVRSAELYVGRARERFRREAQLVATLRHPGIVPVHAFGEEGGVPFYAMEYVDGANLDEILKRLAGRDPATLTGADFERALADVVAGRAHAAERSGPVHLGAAAQLGWVAFCLTLVRQVAEALAHAHECGVVHRDLKPSNLMMPCDGRVQLVDFGLSTSSRTTKITRSGSELGSLPWMAPELLRSGMESVDARSDVYALGVTLYELLTLRSPFAAADNEQTRRNILAGAPRRPGEWNASVPWDAETVCLTAMDVEPARRYATAAAFARDLDHLLALRPIEARRATAWLRARRWAQRNPARAVATALALVVVVGGPIGYAVIESRTAGTLRTMNGQLETKQIALSAALSRENSERGRAEKNATRARGAVVEMLQEVGATDLSIVPQMEPVRRRLLAKALDFYRVMLADTPDDPALRLERARTQRDVADLLSDLGRDAEAEPVYGEAIATFRALHSEHGDDADVVDSLASCLGQLAKLQYDSGQRELAEKNWNEAAGLLEAAAGGSSGRTAVSVNLVSLLNAVGFAAFAHGDPEGSLRHYEKSIGLARRIAAAEGESFQHVSLLVIALDGAATALANLARLDESLAHEKEAWALVDRALAHSPQDRRLRDERVFVANNYGLRLLNGSDAETTDRVLHVGYDAAVALQRDFPDDPEIRKQLGSLAINYAISLANQEEYDAAIPILDQACDLFEKLTAQFRDRIEYPYFLGAALAERCGLQVKLGEIDDAEEGVKRAVTLLQKSVATSNGHPAMKAALVSALFEQGNVRRAQGDLAGALASIREALAQKSARADVLYEGVEILGDCSRDAGAHGGEPTADLFVDLALATLRDAVKGGFSDVARLKRAPELELVRQRDAFQAIVASIGAAPAGR